jgi:hypothetical protein
MLDGASSRLAAELPKWQPAYRTSRPMINYSPRGTSWSFPDHRNRFIPDKTMLARKTKGAGTTDKPEMSTFNAEAALGCHLRSRNKLSS